MHRFSIIVISLFLFGLTACEKVIDLVPESVPPKMVVDGTIENGQPPVIFLTRSLDFFNELTPAMLSASFVRNAQVTVSDGVRTIILKEYPVPIATGVVYLYTVDSTNPASVMLGEMNKTYTLTIEADGEKYDAITTIPPLTKTIDSLWWKPAPNNPDTNRVVLFARVEDPPGRGNYIRYFTARNDSAFLPGINSVFDDAIVDGITYNIQVFRGQDRNQSLDNEEFGYFRLGDRVRVKMTNIDKATFDFWRTWEQNQQNVGNPFSVPIKVLSNISNNGLGIWAGYAVQIERLDIPR
jgi:hypothetical protein